MGVVEGLLYLEKDFLVLRIAELGERGMENGGEENGGDKEEFGDKLGIHF